MRPRQWLLLLFFLCTPSTAHAGEQQLVRQISLFTAITGTLSMLVLASLVMTALALYASSFYPSHVERIRQAQRQHPFACFSLGLINICGMTLVTAWATRAAGGAAKIPSFALIAMVLIGLMSKGLDVGHRTLAASGYTPKTIWSFIAGIPVVLTLSALPLVGWFLFWPYFVAAGFGGALLSFFVRSPTATESGMLNHPLDDSSSVDA